MAGSRLERFGTVFTRVRDLICAGVIKPPEKPIWYDVYRVFPPKRDPLHVKPHSRHCTKKRETVPEIFYREDEVRAKFYEQYGTGPRPFDLSKSSFVSTCQRFVDKYTDLKSHSELEGSAMFEETGKALLTDGIVLRRRGAPPAQIIILDVGQHYAKDTEETLKTFSHMNSRRCPQNQVSAESRDPVLELQLTDMLAEHQSVRADSEEQHTHTP